MNPYSKQIDASVNEKVHGIYTSGDDSAVNELTNLLINALRDGRDDSRSRLRQFFDLPTVSQAESDEAEIDWNLVSRVRLFIDGINANRVDAWLSSYETAPPYSRQRSLLEKILRNFVTSRSEVEAIRCRLAEARALRSQTSSNCAALGSLIKNMSNPRMAAERGKS